MPTFNRQMFEANILYALEYRGRLVGVSISPNTDGEFCNSSTVSLDDCSDDVWVTTDRAIAERVSTTNTPWYASCMNSPKYKDERMVGNLTIVEFYRWTDKT